MREYVVSLRRGADVTEVAPNGSLKDAVREARVQVTEVMPTGESVVVAVTDAAELTRLQHKFGSVCHVVARAKGHVL
jgi:hypothetical protein